MTLTRAEELMAAQARARATAALGAQAAECRYCTRGKLPNGVICGLCDGKGRFVEEPAAEPTVGDRFDALVGRLGTALPPTFDKRSLHWMRMFFNAGFFEGVVEGRAEGREAVGRIGGILKSWHEVPR